MATGGGKIKKSKSAAALADKHPLPSDKLNPKTIDPFKNTKNKSAFESVYASGGIPFRLIHGSVKHKLGCSQPLEEVPFDPVLIYLAEGLRETVHPYNFVARMGFKELLQTVDAGNRALPLVTRLVPPLRAALTHSDPDVFSAGLEAMALLSSVVGPALNPHLKVLLPPVAKHCLGKKHREDIIGVLQLLDKNGGEECLPIIKSKIPTYNSSFV